MFPGILALTRQWKNQLYMPSMVETQARRRRGAFTVHFDTPKRKLLDNPPESNIVQSHDIKVNQDKL